MKDLISAIFLWISIFCFAFAYKDKILIFFDKVGEFVLKFFKNEFVLRNKSLILKLCGLISFSIATFIIFG